MNKYTIKPDKRKSFSVKNENGDLVGMLVVYPDEVRFVGRGKLEPIMPVESGEEKEF